MVSKTDKILDDMRACIPPEKIDDSSKSSYYKAYTRWKPEAEVTFRKITSDIKTANTQKESIHDEIEQCKTELGALRRATAIEKAEHEKTKTTHAALKEQNDEFQARSNEINSKLADLEKRGITESIIEAIASTDVGSQVDLLKGVETVAESEAEEKKLAEAKQATQIILANNSGIEKKLEETKHNVNSWEFKLTEVKEQAKLYEASNLIVQNAFARGYTPETLKMLFNSLERFEVKGMPDASVKRLIRGFDGIKELTELDYHKRRQNAEIEQGNADLAKVKGTTASIVNTSIPTLNQVTAKGIAEITAVKKAAVENINELSQQQQGQLTRLEENAEVNLALLKDSAIEQQQGTLAILNQTMLNISTTFSEYRKDIQQWGAMKAETGKFQAELKWGQYIQQLNNDPKLAAEMSTPLALQLADWLNIWVGKRLPEAKSLPPEYLSKQESGLSRYFPVKFTNITEWVRYELRDLQRRGMI